MGRGYALRLEAPDRTVIQRRTVGAIMGGIFRRLFGGRTDVGAHEAAAARTTRTGRAHSAEARELTALVLHGMVEHRAGPSYPCEVAGESNYQDALWRAVGARKPVDRRRHYVQAALIWEHDNPYDPNAIAVHVQTPSGFEKVGYLPREAAADYQPDFAELRERGYLAGACDAVVVGGFEDTSGRLTSLGIWLNLAEPGDVIPAEGDPEEDGRPAPSRQALRGDAVRGHDSSVSTGQARGTRTAAGMVRGKHYTELVEDVTVLKRHSLEGAIALLREILDAVEREVAETGETIPPWYYEQLAICLRKARTSAAKLRRSNGT